MSDTVGSTSEQVARDIALHPATGNSELTKQQIEFLNRQAELQRSQLEQLEIEKQKLRKEIGHLSVQDEVLQVQKHQLAAHERHLHIEHTRERLHILIQLALCLAVTAVVILFGAMVWSAWKSQTVSITEFSIPPEMESQGLTGQVVAAGLVDELEALQDATRSRVIKRSITDAWSGDVRMEIPETHVSLGEIQRYLRQWLGHDVSIGGSVVRDEKGISLTVRGSGFAGKAFAGELNALPALVKQAAEYAYGQSEPVLFGYYLLSRRRFEEATAVVRKAYPSALEADKPLLLNVWGNAMAQQGRLQEAQEKYRLAIELNPDFWIGYNNVINALMLLGQEEAAAEAGREMERRAGRGRWFARKVDDALWTTLDQLRWDLPATHLENREDLTTSAGHGGSPDADVAAQDAFVLAEMHDARGAMLALQTTTSEAESDPNLLLLSTFVRGVLDLNRGDYSSARAEFRHVEDGDRLADVAITDATPAPACYIAVAEEMTGDPAKADADIARGGHFVDCYRFKGDILDHRGNWEQAQKDYAAAVSLAPSIPSSYESWGDALARHANYAAAFEKFREANARSPHWADPLEHWGEALSVQGKYQEAIEKYDAAQRYAPNWAQLYLHWGQALDAMGKHRSAVERYRRALELDLTEDERKSLAGCCS